MQINSSDIIRFKVAPYSACYLTKDEFISYSLDERKRENSDRDGDEGESFSVLVEIVQAVFPQNFYISAFSIL